MTVSAPAAASDAPAKPKGKKTMLIAIIAVVLLLVIGGGAFMFLNRSHGDEEDAPVAHTKEKDKAPPTFLPMDNMVVNLADPGGEKFAQVGITVEVMDQKTADKVKSYLPTIRSGVLMLISQRTSEELLTKDGKEKLATDIYREVSRPLGYTVEADEEKESEAKPRKKGGDEPRKKARGEPNPVYGVLFSSFIIQ
jgi:flagellar FliL protein